MLAACLGRWDDAERHFTDALVMNVRLGRARRSCARAAPGPRCSATATPPATPRAPARLIAAGRAEAEQFGMAREPRAVRAAAATVVDCKIATH
jgi:hypothetical protein